MKSPCADKYLREIKKICPSYTGPRRGRGQAFFLSTLDEDEREKFMFLENKIRLERNRLFAKKNRDKKKSMLEKLTQDNKELKSLVDNLFEINSGLRNEIKFLKKKEKKEKKERKKEKKEKKEKENLEPAEKKLEDFGHFDFLDNEMEEPVFFESYLN